jgi:hypothetical protein
MTDWGARTRQMGTSPVNLEDIRVFVGGAGPTGRGAKMHLEMTALGTLRCRIMRGRRARSICSNLAFYRSSHRRSAF